MALSEAGIKAVLIAKQNEVMGSPTDSGQQSDAMEALAKALFQILTSDAIIELNNGSDSNGDGLIDKTGVIK